MLEGCLIRVLHVCWRVAEEQDSMMLRLMCIPVFSVLEEVLGEVAPSKRTHVRLQVVEDMFSTLQVSKAWFYSPLIITYFHA